MALTITHTFVSSVPDGSDATVVRPSNWNDSHTIAGYAALELESGAASKLSAISGIVSLQADDLFYIVRQSAGPTFTSESGTVQNIVDFIELNSTVFAKLSATQTFTGVNTFSTGAFGAPTINPLAIIQVSTQNAGQDGILEIDNVSGTGVLAFRRANGTLFGPALTKIVSGNVLGRIETYGYQQTSSAFSGPTAAIRFTATQDFTNAALGTKITFLTVPNGSTTPTLGLTIDQDQTALFGAVPPAATSPASILIQPTGTTSFAGNAAGTMLGLNAATASTYNLIDAQIAGVSKWRLGNTGAVVQAGNLTLSANANTLNLRNGNTVISSPNTAVAQLGDAAGDTNGTSQTLQVQGVTVGGTSDQSGGSLTIASGQGKGSGAVSTVVIQTPTLGSSGTTLQTMATRVTITQGLTSVTGSLSATGGLSSGGDLGSTTVGATQQLFLRNGGTIFTSPVNATWQMGAADANPAVAQTLRVQGATGSNIAGQNWTIQGSPSTGAGASGDVVFQTAGTGAAAATKNTLITALTIKAGTTNNTNVGQPSVVIGNAAIATNATDGFLYITSGAGTPTGTPTGFTGRVPLYYDTTNHQLWVYDGAWLQPKTPAGAATVTWQ